MGSTRWQGAGSTWELTMVMNGTDASNSSILLFLLTVCLGGWETPIITIFSELCTLGQASV
jgi:hypothetical protein